MGLSGKKLGLKDLASSFYTTVANVLYIKILTRWENFLKDSKKIEFKGDSKMEIKSGALKGGDKSIMHKSRRAARLNRGQAIGLGTAGFRFLVLCLYVAFLADKV